MCIGFRFSFQFGFHNIVVTCLIVIFTTVGYMNGIPVVPSRFSVHVLCSLVQLPLGQSTSKCCQYKVFLAFRDPAFPEQDLSSTCPHKYCTTVISECVQSSIILICERVSTVHFICNPAQWSSFSFQAILLIFPIHFF